MEYGFRNAIAKVGLFKFLSDLFWIGMFYHLYNQVSLMLHLIIGQKLGAVFKCLLLGPPMKT